MKSLLQDKSGSVAIFVGLTFSMLACFGAMALDLSNLYLNKTQVQLAADSAALGAVIELPNSSAATTEALTIVSNNTPAGYGTMSKAADIVVGTWSSASRTFTPGSASANAVKVTTHRSAAYGNAVPTFFAKFFGISTLDTTGSAIAVTFSGACVRVMDASASKAVYVQGNGIVSMNCPMQINSSASDAFKAGGSASITTSQTCIVGGYSGGSWSPTPTTGCPSLADPLSAVPEPAAPTCTVNNPVIGSVLASNCTYSGAVTFSGSTTLQSGLFYFEGATVTIGSNANLSGSGVTLFLDHNSTLNLSGGGSVSLTAPASGTYNGILIFQSRSAPSSTTISLGGGSSLAINGTIYAPTATLSLTGNSTSSTATQMGYVIVDQLALTGNSTFDFNSFSSNGVAPRTLRVHAGLVM